MPLTQIEEIAENYSTLSDSNKLVKIEETAEDKVPPLSDLKELSPFYGYTYTENQ